VILGLGGVARSGKDTVADVLEMRGFKRTYMARAVETSLLRIDPFVQRGRRYSDIHAQVGYEDSKSIPEVRRLLEQLAEAMRALDEDVWIDAAFDQIDRWVAQGHDVVVTGVRYENEVYAIKERGGIVAWVERGLTAQHPNDRYLTEKDFDFVIPNTGSVNDLHDWVLTTLRV
jgi:hypothetical protein